jgi:cell division protein FtsB
MKISIKKITFRKIVFVIVMSYCCFVFYNQYANMRKIQKETENKKIELQKLQDENEVLKDKVMSSQKSDSQLTEQYIREKLGMIKQGESIVQDSSNAKH